MKHWRRKQLQRELMKLKKRKTTSIWDATPVFIQIIEEKLFKGK